MKILFFSSQLLFPGTRFGGAKRLYHIARELAKRHDVRVVCLDGCGEAAMLPAVSDFAHFLALPDADKKRGSREIWLRLPADVRGGLERERPRWEAFLAGEKFDAVVLAYPFGLSFLDVALRGFGGPMVYMEDDLYPEFMRLRIAGGAGPLRRFVRGLRYAQCLRFYRRILRRVPVFAGITNQEIAIMNGHLPHARTHLLRYGIDTSRHSVLPPQSPARVGFIGNYRHLPNVDALAWLLETVWPLLKAGLPGARLVLAGNGIPPALRAAHSADASILWMENVPEVADFYREIGIFLNPIRTGRGMRTKLIEAAAFGRPLVSTALGAEGIEDLRSERAETPEDFLAACRRLAGDEALRTAMAAENRARVESAYDISVVARELESLLKPDVKA